MSFYKFCFWMKTPVWIHPLYLNSTYVSHGLNRLNNVFDCLIACERVFHKVATAAAFLNIY